MTFLAELWCNWAWDLFLCWPPTKAASSTRQRCPTMFKSLDTRSEYMDQHSCEINFSRHSLLRVSIYAKSLSRHKVGQQLAPLGEEFQFGLKSRQAWEVSDESFSDLWSWYYSARCTDFFGANKINVTFIPHLHIDFRRKTMVFLEWEILFSLQWSFFRKECLFCLEKMEEANWDVGHI